MKKIVVCMKWGTVFSSNYVNILNKAARKYINDLDAFICLTDDFSGLDPSIDAIEIPDLPLNDSFYKSGAWPKLSLFKKDILPEGCRTLFIDLDMIICGDLNKFFDLPQSFYAIGPESWNAPDKKPHPRIYLNYKIWRNTKKLSKRRNAMIDLGLNDEHIKPNTLGSGIFIFDSGSLNYIYDDFIGNPEKYRLQYDNEQHFLESRLTQWSPWPSGKVIHYKYNLRRPLFYDLFQHPSSPPSDASVVAFSGRPRPHELAENFFSSTKEFPHCRIGKVDWVKKYWQS